MARGIDLAVSHSSFCGVISAVFLTVAYQSRRGPCCCRLNMRAAGIYAVSIRAAAVVHAYSRL